jgi:uncharacterized membrane protein required for colicin V production
MAVIVDIVIVAVMLAGIVLGARRGLLKSIAGVAVVVVALLCAAWIAQRFADPAAKWLEPLLKEQITEKIETQTPADASAGEMLSLFGFSGKTLTQLIETVTNRAIQTGRTLLEEVVGSVLHSIAYAVLFILSFLLLLLVLKLLLLPLDLATKLPGLRTLNGLGGAVLGFAESVLLLYVAVWALRKLQLVITPQLIGESMLLRIFIDYSPMDLITSL